MGTDKSGCRRWTARHLLAIIPLLLAIEAVPSSAGAFSVDESFAQDTRILSLQVGGGTQADIDNHFSNISFLEFMPRASYLPFAPFGSGWYGVALEPGLEGWFEYYFNPKQGVAGGLKAALRLHAIGFGRVVPYLELTAGAGGIALKVPEIRSPFTFILEGGAGFPVFLKRDLAINIGYRFQHLSNGNTSRPNRGYEANMGVLGMSLFLH